MNGKHYKLRFLPLFEDDLNGIVDYIAFRLKNPIAAETLVNDVQKAIQDRLSCAESFDFRITPPRIVSIPTTAFRSATTPSSLWLSRM